MHSQPLVDQIQKSVIGDNQLIETSFGMKPLIYADYTASGRALSFIEDYIRESVLPYYANTHTESSYTGAQTSALREQARNIIHNAVNGNDDDHVIFCGSGATTVINKLIDILNIRLPADLASKHRLLEKIPADERPVVFIGTYEHHSNELPWRESIADIEVIPLNQSGQLNLDILELKLEEHSHRQLKIGSFSAASNVTGIKTDVNRVSRILHENDALVFWDYAAAAPYIEIDMNVQSEIGNCSKDAVFISPHKFIGGPGSPGILVVKKHILKNKVPSLPGGGSVVYVTPEDHKYIDHPVRREEGGTPAIVESIRAGLVFKLQQQVGTDLIESLEKKFVKRAINKWSANKNIEILGNTETDRLSIISFRIKHQHNDLHYGYIVALLNDLFGIQARGGCSCAGPYGHSLLNMDMTASKAIETEISKGHIILRPGWVRINFNYFIGENTFDYIVKAIELVAEHGWQLLPYYDFDQASGTWRFQQKKMALASDIEELDFNSLQASKTQHNCKQPLSEILELALQELQKENRTDKRYEIDLPISAEKLRWFTLPQEVKNVSSIKPVMSNAITS